MYHGTIAPKSKLVFNLKRLEVFQFFFFYLIKRKEEFCDARDV